MSDFWKTLDCAIGYLAAEDGASLVSWTLARKMATNAYGVIIKKNGVVSELEVPSSHPVHTWLAGRGITPETMSFFATAAATDMIADATWNPVLESERGWVRGAWRRPSSLAWRDDEVLSQMYWRSASQGRGLPEHAWVASLKSDLSAPVDAASRRRVLGALGLMMSSYENWENESGFSLRAWAVSDSSWQGILDQAGVGYAKKHEGLSLLTTVLLNESTQPGWRTLLPHILDQRIELLVQPDELPLAWWDPVKLGEAPILPLWCWAVRNSSREAWDIMLERRPGLLNVLDNSGCSPLHWAALTGNERVVTLLLEKGANPAVENLAGLLPEEIVPSGKDELFEKIASQRLSKKQHLA